VERPCRLARRFADGLAAGGAEVVNEVVLNQVLVAVGDAATTKAVIDRIQTDGVLWLGGTTFHGTPALRISVSGWNTREADADRSADAILAAVDAVRADRRASSGG
jgi:glutamate/tyrosine decarboxylase-like PLP-dependent enzyme